MSVVKIIVGEKMQNEAQITAKIITERVSIRNYLTDSVKKEDLDLILEAGRRAPSEFNGLLKLSKSKKNLQYKISMKKFITCYFDYLIICYFLN